MATTTNNRDRGRPSGAIASIIGKMRPAPLLGALMFAQAMPMSGAANAQTPEASSFQDGILACQRIEKRKARFRCYDALESGAVTPAATMPPAAAMPPAASLPPAAAVPPVAPVAAVSKPAAVVPQVTEQAQERRDFGLPEAKKEKKGKQGISVEIVSVKRSLHGDWIFRTSDGQVWRQVDDRKAKFRQQSFLAEIRKAPITGYLIASEEMKLKMRVKRIK